MSGAVNEADVAAAFCAAVVDEGSDVDGSIVVGASARRALIWTLAVWSSGLDEAPLTVIHDLGFVLLRGRAVRFCGSRDRVGVDGAVHDALRAARLAFEDRVVAPWLNDPALLAAHVVIAGLPAASQDAAISHALTAALTRGLPPGTFTPQNLGALRSIQQRWLTEGPNDEASLTDAAAHDDGAFARAVADVEVARAALAGRALLKDEDLWELAHLDDVPSEAARLALRTVHRFMARIGPADPSVIARLKRRSRDVPVDDEDTSAFPTGGFDAMSTQGVFENLVRSEVAYVGEGRSVDDAGNATGPDLFDVRFVEGELLYYTRDESPLLEQRRALVFVVHEVERLRFKPAELPTQTLVLVHACCLRACADLTAGLGPLAVHATFALSGDDPAVVDEELGLLRTSLMADIAHRRVVVVDEADAPRRARIVFSPRPKPAPSKKDAAVLAWVRVGGARWSVDVDGDSFSVDASDLADLRRLVDALLVLG